MLSTTLRRAARLWGIQPSYYSSPQKCVWASEKSILKMLSILSHLPSVSNTEADLQKLILLKKQQRQSEILPPSIVFWNGEPQKMKLRWTRPLLPADLKIELQLESGQTLFPDIQIDKNQLKILTAIPPGYHHLQVKIEAEVFKSFVICAPHKLQDPSDLKKSWGFFLPNYALRSSKDLGIGSLADLQAWAQLSGHHGARWISTLPLLAGRFENKDCDPSPYSALTRLFWNEIYLDLDKCLAQQPSKKATALYHSESFQKEAQRLRKTTHVDYFSVYQLKKQILDLLSEEFFANSLDQTPAFQDFKKLYPLLDAYCQFRTENQQEQNFHRYVQFQMHLQLQDFATTSKVGLYLDFPIGVNDSGFDFAHFQHLFLAPLSVGAPPEPLFPQGQDWGFPPFHPEEMRKDQYRYLRQTLQNHLRYCRVLRLDHVMGLYRIYCVPKGFPGTEGVYLRFPPEEMLAVAILEAHRANAVFVGENLGTVPENVNTLMSKRNVKGMWIAQMQVEHLSTAPSKLDPQQLVALNTHDMPLWKSFSEASDISLLEQLGLLQKDTSQKLRQERLTLITNFKKNFSRDLLQWLAESAADLMIVNPEDLWEEIQPQNIPGTWKEYPNWRRKFSKTLEDFKSNTDLMSRLDIINQLRNFTRNTSHLADNDTCSKISQTT